MDRLSDTDLLDGWIPVRLYWSAEQPTVDWCYLGRREFTASSFTQTVDECLRWPFNLLFRHQTSIDALGLWTEVRRGPRPTGFIFHMSRCGSSLVSQMLAGVQRSIVISEARPIDATLRAHFHYAQLSAEQRILWLRWMISALLHQRRDEEHFFITFHAWNTLELPLIRRAFPDVPWIFLYRDPVEVLVWNMAHRGAHMVPGVINPLLFGMDFRLIAEMQPEEYCAKVLLAISEAALRHHLDGGLLINYSQLPEAVFSPVLELFDVNCTEEELQIIRGAAARDARNRARQFENDSRKKQDRAGLSAREAAAKWLTPIYEQLESARCSTQNA